MTTPETDQLRRTVVALEARLGDAEHLIQSLLSRIAAIEHPMSNAVFAVKMTSGTAWQERTTENGTSLRDFTDGRAGTAAPVTMEAGSALLLEVPGPTAAYYYRIAGGTTASPTTLGSATATAATADTATWLRAGTAGGTPLDLQVDRTAWDAANDKLMAYTRRLRFDSGGVLYEVGTEAAKTIDTPTAC
jgi:hypothetical protein